MDTGQVETEHIEDEMKRTRARIDCKLDELNNVFTARVDTVRRRAPLTVIALLAVSTAAFVWARRRRRQGLPRYSGIPRISKLDEASSR
jgi:hypothetical protein